MPKRSGFTLIELMVVISVIAVLSVIGIASYRGLAGTAKDTKRKADIDAISKAYEQKYDGIANKYNAIVASDFLKGIKPQDPNTSRGDYFNVVATDNTWFKICASLENNSAQYCNVNSATCYCKISLRGKVDSSTGYSGVGAEIGVGNNSSCIASLSTGLLSLWNMNQSFWTGSAPQVTDTAGTSHGTLNGTATPVTGILGNAGSFNGSSYLNLANPSNFNKDNVSVSFWYKSSSDTAQAIFVMDGTGFSVIKVGAGADGTVANGLITFRRLNDGATGVDTSGYASTNRQELFNNQWHLVVITFDSTAQAVKYYLDGVSKTITVGSGALADQGKFTKLNQGWTINNARIGMDTSANGPTYLNGLLDDLRIYNKVLTQAEVTSLYSSGTGCIP